MGHNVKGHEQVSIKLHSGEVIYVDKNMRRLVEVFNEYEGIRTFDSCEGCINEYAHVYLECNKAINNKYDYLNTYVSKIIHLLRHKMERRKTLIPPEYEVDIAINWWGDKEEPFVSIEFPFASIRAITDVFCHVLILLGNDMRDTQP